MKSKILYALTLVVVLSADARAAETNKGSFDDALWPAAGMDGEVGVGPVNPMMNVGSTRSGDDGQIRVGDGQVCLERRCNSMSLRSKNGASNGSPV